jgi:hypothetical protein
MSTTTDLLSFDDLTDNVQSSNNYFGIERELFETKNKLKLLEEKFNRLEDKNDTKNKLKLLEEKFNRLEKQPKQTETRSFTIIPIKTITKWCFCDINATKIKVDLHTHIYFDDCTFCSIADFNLRDHDLNTIPATNFLQQFQNIKTFTIDFTQIQDYSRMGCSGLQYITAYSVFGNDGCGMFSTIRHNLEILLNILKILMNCNKNCEIIYKSTNLDNAPHETMFLEFIKTNKYNNITIEITDNIVVNRETGGTSFVSKPFVNNLKTHCQKNKIVFKSNIGL